MDTKPAILYSRSAVVTDWTCPRKRFYNYEYMGRGITPNETFLELFLGQTVHDGLAAIAHDIPIDDICTAGIQQLKENILTSMSGQHNVEYFANEQAALVEGMLRGFHRIIWPTMKHQYPDVVAVEQEMVYEHDGLTFLAKPDLIVRDREGCLWYVEYKTTSTNKEQWINSWQTAVQLHSSVRAVEATLNEKVTGVVVQGLYKGYVSYEKQNSPFCYAYHKPGEPPFTKEQWAYDYKPGLKKYPVWEKEGGVKAWVLGMPEFVLSGQFPQVPPIFLNEHLIDRFFKQQSNREHVIRSARNVIATTDNDEIRQRMLDDTFPQHFEACNPGWGKGCAYRKLCHGLAKDPLEAGFTMRTSHHELEENALNAASSGE